MSTAFSISASSTVRNLRHPDRCDGHVQVKSLSVAFGPTRNSRVAVAETNFEALPGEFICLLGPSGCGKSTLLNCIAGFVRPSSGVVLVDGTAVRGPGPDRGLVFQQHSLFPWKKVRGNVAFGPRVAGASRSQSRRIADELLAKVGLLAFADCYPGELSGGMQQRVGIARALAGQSKILLMDEPFGSLDAQTRLLMQENLLNVWDEWGTTVLFVTHDIDEAIFLADRVLVMSAAPGRIIADLRIDLPRPRRADSATDLAFLNLRRQTFELIRAESLATFMEQACAARLGRRE